MKWLLYHILSFCNIHSQNKTNECFPKRSRWFDLLAFFSSRCWACFMLFYCTTIILIQLFLLMTVVLFLLFISFARQWGSMDVCMYTYLKNKCFSIFRARRRKKAHNVNEFRTLQTDPHTIDGWTKESLFCFLRWAKFGSLCWWNRVKRITKAETFN